MPMTFPPETEQRMTESIRRYFEEHMEEEVGDLKAAMLLKFFLEELGPTVYNRGVSDAQTRLQGHVADLDGECYAPEFGYWKR